MLHRIRMLSRLRFRANRRYAPSNVRLDLRDLSNVECVQVNATSSYESPSANGFPFYSVVSVRPTGRDHAVSSTPFAPSMIP